jgi:hypothetical protein
MAWSDKLPADMKASLEVASGLRVHDFIADVGFSWSLGNVSPPKQPSASPQRAPDDESSLRALEQSWEECFDAASSTLERFDALASQHRAVASLASSLQDRCKELSDAENKARNVVSKVASVLDIFDSYFVIAARLGLPFDEKDAAPLALKLAQDSADDAAAAASVATVDGGTAYTPYRISPRGPQLLPGHPDFAVALDRIDECIAHLAAHTTYKESTLYLQRFRALQTGALQMVLRAVQVGSGLCFWVVGHARPSMLSISWLFG